MFLAPGGLDRNPWDVRGLARKGRALPEAVMSEEVLDHTEGAAESVPPANGELVHWMQPKPLSVGPAGVSAAALGGFALGVVGTLAALALAGWLGPEREIMVTRRPGV